jgi:hypothetical protein
LTPAKRYFHQGAPLNPARCLGLRLPTVAIALTAFAVPALALEVNIFTTREAGLIQPLLDTFTAETGFESIVLFL